MGRRDLSMEIIMREYPIGNCRVSGIRRDVRSEVIGYFDDEFGRGVIFRSLNKHFAGQTHRGLMSDLIRASLLMLHGHYTMIGAMRDPNPEDDGGMAEGERLAWMDAQREREADTYKETF